MALDKVPASMMSPLSVGETAPSEPYVGQRWYKASTAVTYQYTNDGTSSFWLDVSSGGIGTSVGRGVDIVGDVDPHVAINPAGGVGSVYYNREKNRHFVCTNATSGANVWSGIYSGIGGIVTDYVVSGVYYRSHTFLTSGTFILNDTTSVDCLVVAGGGGGGNGNAASNNAGGGGAGGLRAITGHTAAHGSYTITVGAGGAGASSTGAQGSDGANSVFSTITATGGGGAGGHTGNNPGRTAGSGGGGGSNANAAGGTGNAGSH